MKPPAGARPASARLTRSRLSCTCCFGGSGTVALVAQKLQRDAVLIEISPTYAEMAEKRIRDDAPLFAEVASA